MCRYALCISLCFFSLITNAQRLITSGEAISLALQNKVNTSPASLELLQQQQLLNGSRSIDNPEVGIEKSPYEGALASIEQRLRFPTVYSNRRALQNERIQLSQLMLQLNKYEITRLVQTTYLALQFLTEQRALLHYQDSLYSAMKVAAHRNFDAGQINKLEELFITNQADRVHNELSMVKLDLAAQQIAFGYITNYPDSFTVEQLRFTPLDSLPLVFGDTLIQSARQQALEQQVAISRQQVAVQKAELLPDITAGVLLPLSNNSSSPLGYRLGVSIPLWARQNRAQVAAAKTGVQLAEAQRDRERINLSREYRLALNGLAKTSQSLHYYTSIAVPQSKAIIETALRLFEAGQISYTEALRNMITAFETRTSFIETLRGYNQSLIELNYLTGNK